MAVTKKPKPAAAPVDVDALIRKGGSVAAEPAANPPQAALSLRLPACLLARIDRAVQAREVKVPRHTWLLEAIAEKLQRESF